VSWAHAESEPSPRLQAAKAPGVFPGGCCNPEDNGVASWLKDDGVEGEGGKKSVAAWLLAQVA
jgi:hypothetical protein